MYMWHAGAVYAHVSVGIPDGGYDGQKYTSEYNFSGTLVVANGADILFGRSPPVIEYDEPRASMLASLAFTIMTFAVGLVGVVLVLAKVPPFPYYSDRPCMRRNTTLQVMFVKLSLTHL